MSGSAPVEVPRSLRAVVRVRRDGWRLRIGPAGVLGLVVPVLLMGIAVVLAIAAKHVAVGFRRVDIWPAAAPTRIVAAGWVRRSVIEVADLTGVIVRHRDPDLELVLRAGATTLVCPATVGGPLRRVEPRVLANWLADILTPSETPVCHHHATLPLPIGLMWLPANTVADLWQVPVADVPVLADRRGVHLNNGSHTTMFNAYDVEASEGRL